MAACPVSLKKRISAVRKVALRHQGTQFARVAIVTLRDAERAAGMGLCYAARRELKAAVRLVREARRR